MTEKVVTFRADSEMLEALETLRRARVPLPTVSQVIRELILAAAAAENGKSPRARTMLERAAREAGYVLTPIEPVKRGRRKTKPAPGGL